MKLKGSSAAVLKSLPVRATHVKTYDIFSQLSLLFIGADELKEESTVLITVADLGELSSLWPGDLWPCYCYTAAIQRRNY